RFRPLDSSHRAHHHRQLGHAPDRRVALRPLGRPLRPPQAADLQRPVLFADPGPLRPGAELHRVPRAAPSLWHRHGRRMGRGRLAGARVRACALARPALGISARRVRARQHFGRGGVFHHLPRLRLAHAVLSWRASRPAFALHPVQGQGTRSLEARAHRLVHVSHGDLLEWQALPVSGCADGDDEPHLPRHPGHVPHVLGGAAPLQRARNRAMIWAVLLAVLAIPLWIGGPTTALIVAGAFVMQFLVQGAWGVIPAHLNELSPSALRGFFPGFAYQLGVLIASSVAYVEAVLAQHFSYALAMGSLAAVVLLVGALVIAL